MPFYITARVSEIKYRPHIDGLRALAVCAVIFYHAKLFGLSGGFVGVDIFFVISGFVITCVIMRDLRRGTFSMWAFWERRIRRIFPALFVVMLSTIVGAYFIILYPADYHHFGSTVVAQSVFVSNVLFTISDSYFDQPSHFSPLLHTWTLSVEEQFYICFPFLVLLAMLLARTVCMRGETGHLLIERRVEKSLLIGIIAISVVSFLVSVWLVVLRPGTAVFIPHTQGLSPVSFMTAGFYLLPSRAWELGLGAILALASLRIKSAAAAEWIALGGMVSILVSLFAFNDATPFPGIAALLPALGTVGIIVSNEHHATRLGRALSWPVVVSVGLLSYSLYLWHWPVFVFANLVSATPPSAIVMVALTIVVFILSWLSYKFVEVPFRSKAILTSTTSVYILGAASMGVLFLVGFCIYRGSLSNEDRIPPAAMSTLRMIEGVTANRVTAYDTCVSQGGEGQDSEFCKIGAETGTPKFVVWGDSHAAALVPLYDKLGKEYGAEGVAFAPSGCIPVIGVWIVPPSPSCDRDRDEALRYIRDKDIKTIFIAAEWSAYVMGGRDQTREARITDTYHFSATAEQAQSVLQRHLAVMVKSLEEPGRNIYIMQQVPEQFNFVPRIAFYQAVQSGRQVVNRGVGVSTNSAYQKLSGDALKALTAIPGVHFLDPASVLCKDGSECALKVGDVLLYQDDNHLSAAGAMELRPLFLTAFEAL
jgi:peptidoglycan/LPS O-acetylase OafA/YrhL